MRARLILSTSVLALTAVTTFAASAQTETVEAVTVTASKVRSLDQFTPTASRLGLSTQEIPATIDMLDADEMTGRGLASVEQAATMLTGVTSGGSPGDPAALSMRGFSGDEIMTLHNGLYIGPANMVNRPGNSFNLASVEALKGPASVLYGQGAIGGVLNIINKGPSFGAPELNWIASIGSFGTTNIGIGGGTHFGDTVAVRADFSRTSTDGYVKNSGANSTNGTASLLWRPISTLQVQVMVDYLDDNPSKYFGTPWVPATSTTDALKGIISSASGLAVDKRMRYVNYNVSDANIHSDQYWPQVLATWTPNEKLTIENNAYYYHANRKWIDAETYSYNPATKLVDRDRFFVIHRQELFGDQLDLTYKSDLISLPNTVVVGFDYSHLNFMRTRGFPDGDSVDPFNPSAGVFGDMVAKKSPTHYDNVAVFGEDVLSLTPAFKLVLGGRFDHLDLDRQNYNFNGSFNAGSSFKRGYDSTNWRAGLVYDITENITPYVSYSTGTNPVNSDLFLVNAGENFSMSSSSQEEVGVKMATDDKTADLTVSLYNIKRDNILMKTSIDTVSNVGSQSSKGAEVSGDWKPLENWTFSANLAYTDAHYGADFVDPNSGLPAGHAAPPNVPNWTGNLWTSVKNVGGIPLELGGGIRYVGLRNAYTPSGIYKLQDYTLVNVYASYPVADGVLLTGRVNNLFDKAYAQWSDVFYGSEVILGSPRSFEVSIVGKL